MPNCRFAYPRGGSSMSSVGVVDWLNAADTGHPSQSTPSMGGNAAPCGVDGSAGSLLRSFARTPELAWAVAIDRSASTECSCGFHFTAVASVAEHVALS